AHQREQQRADDQRAVGPHEGQQALNNLPKTHLNRAVAAAAPAAHAQSVRFGLKAGANLSNLSGDLTQQDQYKNRFGFQGGAMLNLGLVGDDFLAIQLEALYSQKGFKYADQQFTIGGTNFRNTGNVRYDYLDIPQATCLAIGRFGFHFKLAILRLQLAVFHAVAVVAVGGK
nr:hypothetical protein [Tanacetum cinerariifolium]